MTTLKLKVLNNFFETAIENCNNKIPLWVHLYNKIIKTADIHNDVCSLQTYSNNLNYTLKRAELYATTMLQQIEKGYSDYTSNIFAEAYTDAKLLWHSSNKNAKRYARAYLMASLHGVPKGSTPYYQAKNLL